MTYRKINPFLLGVCIAYISLGICQLTKAHMFSSRLYMTVAIVSSNLSIVELSKSLTKRIEGWRKRRQTLLEENVLQKEYSTPGHSTANPDSFDKKSTYIVKVGNIAVTVGYVVSVYFMITTPFKAIPDTERTNIVIGATSLFTFALLFISMIINEAADYDDREYEDSVRRLKRDQAILSHLESLKAQRQDDADTENAVEEK